MESYYELEPESSDYPDGPQIHRKGWRSKSKPNGAANLNSTDSTERASGVESEASWITHQISTIRMVKRDQQPSSDDKVPTVAHEGNCGNSSGISAEGQEASSSEATVKVTTKSQEQKVTKAVDLLKGKRTCMISKLNCYQN